MSWTVSHRSFQPDRTVPYVVVLVRLAEGAELILPGGWAGASDGSDLEVGSPVRAGFDDAPGDGDGPGWALLSWQPMGLA